MDASAIEQQQRRPAAEFTTLLTTVAEFFPAVFTVAKHEPHRPLAVGIDRDVETRCPALATSERLMLLRMYTSRRQYRQALVVGAPRIDLDGNAVGVVTAKQAAYAELQIAAMLAVRAAAAAAVKQTKAAPAKPAKAAKPAEPVKPAAPVKPVTTSIPDRRPAASPNSTKPKLTLPFMRSPTNKARV